MRLLKFGILCSLALATAGCVSTGQGLSQPDADAFVKKAVHEGEKPGKVAVVN